MSKEAIEAADIIEGFLDGICDEWDWDDFTSTRYKDPVVEAARLRCLSVADEYPREQPNEYCSTQGQEVLRQLVTDLRQRAKLP